MSIDAIFAVFLATRFVVTAWSVDLRWGWCWFWRVVYVMATSAWLYNVLPVLWKP